MSLKAIHIIFIIASTALALFLAFWAFKEFFSGGGILPLLGGVLALASMAGLLWYGKYFLNKLKHIAYL